MIVMLCHTNRIYTINFMKLVICNYSYLLLISILVYKSAFQKINAAMVKIFEKYSY